jgi:hypothetical protein
MLGDNGILRHYRNGFCSCHGFPMPSNHLRLEKGFKRQMRQLQLCSLGQCCNQHSSRHHNHSSSHERTPKSAAQREKEDRHVCHVRSGRLVSLSFHFTPSWSCADTISGFSVCITSMIRLESLRTFGLTADPTWDNIPTTFWSTLETCTAIFCSCMPAIRAGIIRFFPRILDPAERSINIFSGQPSNSPDDEPVPCRVVEEKHKGNPISLLPTTLRTKAHQSPSAAIFETAKAGIKEGERKFNVGSIRRLTPITEFLRRIEREKPLPLLPMLNTIQPPKLSTGAEGEETREVGDPAESSSSTFHHFKSFV